MSLRLIRETFADCDRAIKIDQALMMRLAAHHVQTI
jgi:hypothetical protein